MADENEEDSVEVEEIVSSSACSNCDSLLKVPWIRCVACKPRINICTSCFAMGVEFGCHENNHPYSVIKFDFEIYEENWTATEELHLLDAINENGFGNWSTIGQRMRTKTAAECEKHYMTCYIEKPQPPLPEFSDDRVVDHGAPIIFKLSDNPPRPLEGSPLSNDMGGYSAARGDFSVEFDNFFELDICHMKLGANRWDDGGEEGSEDEELYTDMNLKVLEIYRTCLKERQWRKRFVRDYGLINLRKWCGMFRRRFEKNIPFEFFRPFMQFFPSIVFDKYLESLLYEMQLKSDITKLQEYRRNGITRLHSIQPFHIMKQRREQTRSKRNLLHDVLHHIQNENHPQSWLARQVDLEPGVQLPNIPVNLPRKAAPPLSIEGMPGYEKLNAAERKMCSEVRLVPQAYLDFSKILKTECNKWGFLKLAQARALIKIDVNKTRKLYNFMMLHGMIQKEPL